MEQVLKEEKMDLTDGLVLAAIVLSPLIALSVERWRRRADRQGARERELLYDLVRARAATRGPAQVRESAEILERALNAIPIVFSGSERISNAFRDFHEASSQAAKPAIRDQKLIGLILTICRQLGYNKVEESTITNVLFLGRNP